MEITLTSENFEKEVLQSNIPVLVDFWASWCGPCKMIAPILSEIAEEYDGEVKVGKVNVDEQQALAVKFSIMSIPTVMLFENGELKKTEVGYMPKAQIENMFR